VPALSVGDTCAREGSATSPGTLVFKVSLSAVSSQIVSFRYATQDGTASAPSDYQGTGTLRLPTGTIPAGSTSTTISIPIVGDAVVEPDETMRLNISSPSNATIADGQGVGVIVNDDGILISKSCLGTFDVTPAQATVAVGERLPYDFSWTVPSGSWRQLDSLELRIGDNGSLLWLRFDESTRTFSLRNPATGEFGPPFAGGSANVLTSGAATLYLSESGFVTAGPTSPEVTLRLSLGFQPRAIGSDYPVEVRATNDDGQVEGFVRAATLTITSPQP
jgi:hypothetical protein